MKHWVYDPQSGGTKIPPRSHEDVARQVESWAGSRSWYPRVQLKLRFRNQFCYVDSATQGDERVFPLCRLRHFGKGRWSFALFTYSHERYEPCTFPDGTWEGTIESALQSCEGFID